MELFSRLKISNIRKTTRECSVVEIDVPENLQQQFIYKQGQFLTFKKKINGEIVQRSYSLCSSPTENKWQVAIKKIPLGVFSTYANEQLKVGDTIEVMKPAGNFYIEVAPEKSRNFIAFAAGSGITPILSIIKTHLTQEPHSTFVLLYVNSRSNTIILKEEIESLKNTFLNRFQVFYFLTKEQRNIPFLNGRFNPTNLNHLFTHFINLQNIDHCFLCGPKDMVFFLKDFLKERSFNDRHIHYELFFAGSKEPSSKSKEILKNKASGSEITVIDGGKEFHFTLDEDYDNILDAALAFGADLPFACKGGVCCTCKCKVIEGKVEMKINYALEKEEVAQNFVLSCQAVPVTNKVKVDFDV